MLSKLANTRHRVSTISAIYDYDIVYWVSGTRKSDIKYAVYISIGQYLKLETNFVFEVMKRVGKVHMLEDSYKELS